VNTVKINSKLIMMKVYKNVKPIFRLSKAWFFAFIAILTYSTQSLNAQCIFSTTWSSGTLSSTSSPAVTFGAFAWAGEFVPTTFVDDGVYEIGSTIATDFLTITDASNNVIDFGPQPLTVSIPSSGLYRIHIASNSSCGTGSPGRSLTGEYIGPLATPLVAVVGNGTLTSGTTQNASPIYRSSTTSTFNFSMSVQLMTQADLAAAGVLPGSDITQIAYFKTTAFTMDQRTATYRVYVRNSTSTALVSGSPFSTYTAGSTLVYENLNMGPNDIPASAGWMELPFSSPFTYTGGSIEVALEWSVNPGTSSNISTGAFQWQYGVVPTAQAIGWSSSTAPTASTNLTTSTNFLYNCQVSFFPSAGTDLGISEFVNPVAACPGATPVTVAVINAGAEAITSATIGWTLNGITQTPVNWTGNLASTGDTAHINLGSFPSVVGTNYNIEAFISAVGPGLDSTTLNDTLNTLFVPAMSGTFTVDAGSPASATNFQSLVDFANTVNISGICGPVVVNVAANSGPYVGRVEFGEIIGSSAVNTITINGNGNLLSNTATTTDERAALMLNGTDYMTIDSLNIEAEGTWAWGVQLINAADHNTIKNCRIEVPTTSTSTFFANVVMSGSATGGTTFGNSGSFNTFENNHNIGGYWSYSFAGESATNRNQDNKIINCVMEDMALYGVYCTQQEGTEVIGCDISQPNRTNGSTFYGIFFTSSVPAEVSSNRVHDVAANFSTTVGCYPYYFTGSGGASASNPLKLHNNAAYNLFNNGLQYGIYMLGLTDNIEVYHNSIILENLNQTGTSTLACLYHTGVATDVDLKNNIFHINNSNTGTQYNIWFSNANPGFSSDYNVFYNSNSSGIVARRGTTNSNTLADWQASNGNIYDQNSQFANPVFGALSNGNISPLSSVIDNIGTPVGITTDINGAARSTTTPDVGAVEFVGVASDIALTEWDIFKGECLTNNDTISLTIRNVIGPAVNLATNNVVANWQVTGPVTSNGTITFNTGTLAPDASLSGIAVGVDLSVPGMYTVNAWLDTSSTNLVALNDTISGGQYEVRPIISVNPQTVNISNSIDDVEISVNSPFMPGGGVFITEISHFKSSTGAPVGGWPTYLVADDYIEVTGVPNSDIGGITLEVWTTASQNTNYTFPAGTLLSSSGTAIIAVGQLGSSQPSPSDYYYHGNGAFTSSYGSATAIGYILKDAGGNIIDAAAYSGSTPYVFPAAANVSTSDWSGSVPSGSGTAGIRLEGPNTNSSTNWIVSSSTAPQDPNSVNNNVTVPAPVSLTGLQWSHQGVVIDTVANITVGPWPTPGTYYYVATYQSPCGPLTDSVEVIVDFPFCFDPDSLMVDAACEEAEVSWVSGVWTNSSTIEYGPAGFTQGTGTVVTGATSPFMITGLTPLTDYDVYVMDSCAGWLSGAVAYDSTLAASIESEYNLSPTTSSTSLCAGSVSVNVPAGSVIDSVSVEYNFTAGGGAWMGEQLSYVACTSPGGVAESAVSAGVGNTAGTFSYNRSGLTIANGVAGGGNIDFTLHAFRTWGGSGCDNIYNVVDAGSFKVTIFTADSVFTQIGESMAMETFSTIAFPVAGINVNDNGNGNYDFSADTTTVGTVSWDFGDGNSANGDTVNHTYAAPGTYTVTMIATNACGSDTATVTVNFISVEKFGFTNVSIFPNPTAGAFAIDNLPQEGGDIIIRINDMQGRTVMSKVLSQGQQQRLDMDLSNLRSGTYFLNISNDAGTITKPVILNK
jgi:hypothetical protein